MLPYVIVPPFSLGPLTVQPFGVLVMLGIIVGWKLAMRRALQLGLRTSELESLLWWVTLSGFVGAHIVENVLYHPTALAQQPLRIFMLWKGLSSFGGFIGALVGALAWKYYAMKPLGGTGSLRNFAVPARRTVAKSILPLVDVILSVFPVAWAFGRLGCTIAHDHPGAIARVGNWFTVAYGRGPTIDYGLFQLRYGTTPRYDLGLLEFVFTLVIALAFSMSWRHGKPRGYYVASLCLLYAPVRFCFDTLRASPAAGGDIRYAGLTPAQWSCLPLFAFGLWMAFAVSNRIAKAHAKRRRVDTVTL